MKPEITKARAQELLDGFNRLNGLLDGLPEGSREPFRKLANQAARECENLGSVARQLEDSLADLHLSTAHAKFELFAMRQDIRDILPEPGLDR